MLQRDLRFASLASHPEEWSPSPHSLRSSVDSLLWLPFSPDREASHCVASCSDGGCFCSEACWDSEDSNGI